MDEGSVAMFADDKKFLDDPVVQQKLASATPLADVDPAAYDAVFYPGGHGPVLDLASDPVNAKIASEVRLLRLCYYFSLGLEGLWGGQGGAGGSTRLCPFKRDGGRRCGVANCV